MAEYRYYEDGYHNRYAYWLRPEPPDDPVAPGKFKAAVYRWTKSGHARVRTRYFTKRKSAKAWCLRLYRTKQNRYLQVQERRRQRALERKNRPRPPVDKIKEAEAAVDEALMKLKEIERKETLLSTLRKRWTRRLGARVAYVKKLRSEHIDTVTQAVIEASDAPDGNQ